MRCKCQVYDLINNLYVKYLRWTRVSSLAFKYDIWVIRLLVTVTVTVNVLYTSWAIYTNGNMFNRIIIFLLLGIITQIVFYVTLSYRMSNLQHTMESIKEDQTARTEERTTRTPGACPIEPVKSNETDVVNPNTVSYTHLLGFNSFLLHMHFYFIN